MRGYPLVTKKYCIVQHSCAPFSALLCSALLFWVNPIFHPVFVLHTTLAEAQESAQPCEVGQMKLVYKCMNGCRSSYSYLAGAAVTPTSNQYTKCLHQEALTLCHVVFTCVLKGQGGKPMKGSFKGKKFLKVCLALLQTLHILVNTHCRVCQGSGRKFQQHNAKQGNGPTWAVSASFLFVPPWASLHGTGF